MPCSRVGVLYYLNIFSLSSQLLPIFICLILLESRPEYPGEKETWKREISAGLIKSIIYSPPAEPAAAWLSQRPRRLPGCPPTEPAPHCNSPRSRLVHSRSEMKSEIEILLTPALLCHKFKIGNFLLSDTNFVAS